MSVASAVATLALPCPDTCPLQRQLAVSQATPLSGLYPEAWSHSGVLQGQDGLFITSRNSPPPRAAQQLLLCIPGMPPPGQLLGSDPEALLGLPVLAMQAPGSQDAGERVIVMYRAGQHGRFPSLGGTSTQRMTLSQ